MTREDHKRRREKKIVMLSILPFPCIFLAMQAYICRLKENEYYINSIDKHEYIHE